MMGQTDSEAEEGLIPRICKALFEKVEKKRNKNEAGSPSASNQTAYRAEVSYLEIYNEKVRDLLRSSGKNLSTILLGYFNWNIQLEMLGKSEPILNIESSSINSFLDFLKKNFVFMI